MSLIHVQCLELYHVHYKHPIILVVVITISNTMIAQAANSFRVAFRERQVKELL